MPLDEEHIEEICSDVIEQYERKTADCALFVVKLVPEGDPPLDKAALAASAYKKFKERLQRRGYNAGILAQCTLGHGYPLDTPFAFQNVVNFNNGEDVIVACPLDNGVRAYLRASFKTLAACRPESIMIDDDFRLLYRPGVGCGCPLHMREFNKKQAQV